MVHILLIKNTTLVTMDMSKSTCPKWSNGFFYTCPNWVFFTRFIGKKIKNFSNGLNFGNFTNGFFSNGWKHGQRS
jgi:hypothetical protein